MWSPKADAPAGNGGDSGPTIPAASGTMSILTRGALGADREPNAKRSIGITVGAAWGLVDNSQLLLHFGTVQR